MTYTPEQLTFLEEHYQRRYYKELTQMFNAKFGTTRTQSQIGAMCYSRGWTNELKWRGEPKRKYPAEQIEYLRRNVKGRPYPELTAMFNQHFGTDISTVNLSALCRYHGLSNGVKGGYKKGHEGVRGSRNNNYLPDGSEVVDSQGYAQVKVDGVWRKKHIMLWEEANGQVPEDHYIVFGDGNRTNVCLDNLHCIPINQAGIWTMRGLQGDTPELAQVGLALSALYAQINARQKKQKKR